MPISSVAGPTHPSHRGRYLETRESDGFSAAVRSRCQNPLEETDEGQSDIEMAWLAFSTRSACSAGDGFSTGALMKSA